MVLSEQVLYHIFYIHTFFPKKHILFEDNNLNLNIKFS